LVRPRAADDDLAPHGLEAVHGHDTDVPAPGGAEAGATIPAWRRFWRTIRTNAGGAASGRSARFEWPAYETRVSTTPMPKTTIAAVASTNFACVARLLTG